MIFMFCVGQEEDVERYARKNITLIVVGRSGAGISSSVSTFINGPS